MNVEMSALKIQKMSQSHPISRRGKKNTKKWRYCTDPVRSNESVSNKNSLLSIISTVTAPGLYNKT